MDQLSGDDDLKELFTQASSYVKSVVGKLDSQRLLYLYARFKQANEGPCNVPKPGFFDFQGKQKWEAWHKLGSLSQEDAMHQYVTAVGDYDPEWEAKMISGEVRPVSGLGVAVSTLSNHDDHLSDHQKTAFDWCKEGDVGRVAAILSADSSAVHQTDDDGMSLLHWACDRGHLQMTDLLLARGTNINLQDTDGQTSLHYAAACDHPSIVRRLLAAGAVTTVTDSEGQTPSDVAETADVRRLLANT